MAATAGRWPNPNPGDQGIEDYLLMLLQGGQRHTDDPYQAAIAGPDTTANVDTTGMPKGANSKAVRDRAATRPQGYNYNWALEPEGNIATQTQAYGASSLPKPYSGLSMGVSNAALEELMKKLGLR